MSDLPPDLPRLQVLRTYLRLQLDAVDARIREIEGAANGSQPVARGVEPTRRGQEAAKELKWWRFVPAGAGETGGTLHRGDCPVVLAAACSPCLRRS